MLSPPAKTYSRANSPNPPDDSKVMILLPSNLKLPYRSPGFSYSIETKDSTLILNRKTGPELKCKADKILKSHEAGYELVRLTKGLSIPSLVCLVVSRASLEMGDSGGSSQNSIPAIREFFDSICESCFDDQQKIKLEVVTQFGTDSPTLDYFSRDSYFASGSEQRLRELDCEGFKKLCSELEKSICNEPFTKFMVNLFPAARTPGSDEQASCPFLSVLVLRSKNSYALKKDQPAARDKAEESGLTSPKPGQGNADDLSLEGLLEFFHRSEAILTSKLKSNQFCARLAELKTLVQSRYLMIEPGPPSDLQLAVNNLEFIQSLLAKPSPLKTKYALLQPSAGLQELRPASARQLDLLASNKNGTERSIILRETSAASVTTNVTSRLASTIKLIKPIFSFFRLNYKKVEKYPGSGSLVDQMNHKPQALEEPELWTEIELNLRELNRKIEVGKEAEDKEAKTAIHGKTLIFKSLLETSKTIKLIEDELLRGRWSKKDFIEPKEPSEVKPLAPMLPLATPKEPNTQHLSPIYARNEVAVTKGSKQSRLKQMFSYLPSFSKQTHDTGQQLDQSDRHNRAPSAVMEVNRNTNY